MGKLRKLRQNVLAFGWRVCYSVVVAVVAVVVVLVGGAAVQAQEPPPTPTLAPIISTTTSATQTYQLQEFARSSSYLVDHTTVFTSTVGGATWAVERKFSYGEAGITVVVMALALVETLRLIYQAVNDGRVRW